MNSGLMFGIHEEWEKFYTSDTNPISNSNMKNPFITNSISTGRRACELSLIWVK